MLANQRCVGSILRPWWSQARMCHQHAFGASIPKQLWHREGDSRRERIIHIRSYSSLPSDAPPKPLPKTSITRFLPKLPSAFSKSPESSSSFRKLVSLAKAERKPLTTAVGLLLVSASVSLSVPFTIGKLIDFFSTTNPVRVTHYVVLMILTKSCSNYPSDCLRAPLPPYSSFCSPQVPLQMQVVQ